MHMHTQPVSKTFLTHHHLPELADTTPTRKATPSSLPQEILAPLPMGQLRSLEVALPAPGTILDMWILTNRCDRQHSAPIEMGMQPLTSQLNNSWVVLQLGWKAWRHPVLRPLHGIPGGTHDWLVWFRPAQGGQGCAGRV